MNTERSGFAKRERDTPAAAPEKRDERERDTPAAAAAPAGESSTKSDKRERPEQWMVILRTDDSVTVLPFSYPVLEAHVFSGPGAGDKARHLATINIPRLHQIMRISEGRE